MTAGGDPALWVLVLPLPFILLSGAPEGGLGGAGRPFGGRGRDLDGGAGGSGLPLCLVVGGFGFLFCLPGGGGGFDITLAATTDMDMGYG